MSARAGPHVVTTKELGAWLREGGGVADVQRTIGPGVLDGDYLEEKLGVPHHVRFVAERLLDEQGGAASPDGRLASIPFHSLCRGLFLPLSGLAPDRVAQLFSLRADEPLDVAGKEALLERFFAADVGLSPLMKLGCVLGDPFRGRRSLFRRDSLLRVLQGSELVSRRALLDALARRGDVAILFADSRPFVKGDPPLTAAEVLETLRFLRHAARADQLTLVRGLVERMGKLEAYFFAKLMMRTAGFGFDYQGMVLARALGRRYGVDADAIVHAMALRDAFNVVETLERDGPEGLRAISLQPLVPVRPALATTNPILESRFPVWVERKYDGIRLMVHKASDRRGHVLVGAYTRRRGDWLELIPGMDVSAKAIPARAVILDGELFGTILDARGARPATVYDVYAALQGERALRLNLRYAAFDVLYLDGRDLTGLPFTERRRVLQGLLSSMTGLPLPVPFSLAEGQIAERPEDVNRLYGHFRAQGYEGVIAKELDGKYLLAARDPTWRKKKPEETLDLVLLGAVFAVTTKENAGLFGSYVIGARTREGGFVDVGDIAGLDRARDLELQQEIMREGLLTGRRIERASASGARPGVELKPHVVVAVRFDGIVKDHATGKLSLRDPKLAFVRADKGAQEADLVTALEEHELKARIA